MSLVTNANSKTTLMTKVVARKSVKRREGKSLRVLIQTAVAVSAIATGGPVSTATSHFPPDKVQEIPEGSGSVTAWVDANGRFHLRHNG